MTSQKKFRIGDPVTWVASLGVRQTGTVTDIDDFVDVITVRNLITGRLLTFSQAQWLAAGLEVLDYLVPRRKKIRLVDHGDHYSSEEVS